MPPPPLRGGGIIITIIKDLYSAFRSEDTEAQLLLFAMYATNRQTGRRTDERTKATLIAPFATVGGIIIR